MAMTSVEEIGHAAVAVKQASNKVKEWGHRKALELQLVSNSESPYWKEYEEAQRRLDDLLEQYCPYRAPNSGTVL